GLADEAPGAEPDGFRAAVVVARPGVDEHRHPEPTSLHGSQHFEAVHPRHFQVEDDAIHRLALQQIERRAARERDEHVVAAYALQVVRVLLRHGGYDLKRDRKSTRLNSSHVSISYAVSCLIK